MQVTALIVTEHAEFGQTWNTRFNHKGIASRVVSPNDLADHMAPGSPIIFDAGSPSLQNDELMVMCGYAKAMGAVPAVVGKSGKNEDNADVIDDVCQNLVAYSEAEETKLFESIARKVEALVRHHFEYVTVAPSGKDILAIYADGDCVLLPRPIDTEDDLSEVSSIQLSDADTLAQISLASGKTLRLHALSPNHPHRRPSSMSGLRRSGSFGRHTSVPGEGKAARLGARIRELRVAAGLTQAELAKRTGIHRPNIARVEAGRHTPSLETLAKLSLAMGVTTTDLIADE